MNVNFSIQNLIHFSSVIYKRSFTHYPVYTSYALELFFRVKTGLGILDAIHSYLTFFDLQHYIKQYHPGIWNERQSWSVKLLQAWDGTYLMGTQTSFIENEEVNILTKRGSVLHTKNLVNSIVQCIKDQCETVANTMSILKAYSPDILL